MFAKYKVVEWNVYECNDNVVRGSNEYITYRTSIDNFIKHSKSFSSINDKFSLWIFDFIFNVFTYNIATSYSDIASITF